MTTESAVFDTLKYRVEVDEFGTRRYYNSAGDLHRDEGPAVEFVDKSERWFQDGLCHREDGPAIVLANGNKEWYLNGRRHCADGPAVDAANGYKEWHLHDKLHRTDGPAVIHEDGTKEWWIHGVQYDSEQDYHTQLKAQDIPHDNRISGV